MVTRLPLKGLIVILLLAPLFVMVTPSVAAPPQGPMHTTVHVVRPGETLYSIARSYGVSPYQIAMANHLVNPNLIYAGQRLVVPAGYGYTPPQAPQPSTQVYVVRPGETLFSVAMRFGTTVNAIAMANNITNPNLVFAGQQLVIPTGKPGQVYAPPTKVVKKVVVVEKKPEPEPLKPALCNERTQITWPRHGETLNGVGTFDIRGTAAIDDFQFYKLELGVGRAPIDFSSIAPVQRHPVVRGILLRDWNTGALPEGTYILRLTVVDNRGQFPPPCDVLIHIDHSADVDP